MNENATPAPATVRPELSPRRQGVRFRKRLWSASLRSLPDFALVGGQRCGSTTLHDCLIQHPRIVAPLVKEVHYFDRDSNYARGEVWYRAHFGTRLALRLRRARTFDGTPDTLFRRRALERMRACLGPVPVFAVLREPIARAYSAWNRRRRSGKELLPFETVTRRELDWLVQHGPEAIHAPWRGAGPKRPHSYLARGLWAIQLTQLTALFGSERSHVILADELFADPQAVCDRIFRQVGLPPHVLTDLRVKNANAYDSQLDPEVRGQLEAFFAPHNERLAELLERELPW